MNDKKIKTILLITGVFFVFLLTVLTGVTIYNEIKKANFIGLDSDHLRTINVTGEGKVYAIPDTASVSFSVITENENSEIALDENNEKASAVVNFLKEQGVEEENIQTTGINVQPIYDRSREREGEVRIIRYEVTNRVDVELEDLDNINTVIDGTVRAGANRVDSFEFLVSSKEDLRAEAREKAIKEARTKAEKTASSLGVKLGRVIDFSETRDYYLPSFPQREVMDSIEEVPDMPIETGENEIKIQVNIDFEII